METATSPAYSCQLPQSTLDFDFDRNLRQQLASVFCMIQIARKMRMTVPENTKMAVQSVSAGGPSASPTQPEATGAPFPRRYSKAQGEETEDTFNTEEILQRFNHSMVLQRPKGFNLYESYSDDESSQSSSKPLMNRYLRRRMSASDISKVDPAQALAAIKDAAPAAPAAEPSPGLLSRYLGRRGSAGSILATMSGANVGSNPTSEKTGDNQSALVPATTPPIARSQSSADMTDGAALAQPSPPSQGFGIFSKTRQFGAWLTKATEGEKMEVSRPDLNAVAPTSF